MLLNSTDLSIITGISNKYYQDSSLIKAIVLSEGGHDAFIKAIQCTSKFKDITDFATCVEILCQSLIHRQNQYIFSDVMRAHSFIKFFGDIWAPPEASNDPTDLNKNWVGNVLKLWGK